MGVPVEPPAAPPEAMEGFGDPCSLDAFFRKLIHNIALLGIGQFENAERKVGGHQGSRLAQEHFVEGAAESTDAGERADADGDCENHKQKFEG